MSLFTMGNFLAHSGQILPFKIDCDFLDEDDLETLAELVAKRIRFGCVVGIPNGGCRFARHLETWATGNTNDPILIADDVLTTGNSMEDARSKCAAIGQKVVGVVIFSRTPSVPDWIRPICTLNPEFML